MDLDRADGNENNFDPFNYGLGGGGGYSYN